MGSPFTDTSRVADPAALANADRVTGGSSPPATRASALDPQRDVVHDRALYDMGMRGWLSDVAGGSAATYYGTIVPENPQEGQITEARFLQVLATELARQLIGIGQGDGPDAEFTEVLRGMLEKLFQVIVPPGARMERVLRAALLMSPSLNDFYSVDDFVMGLLTKMVKPLIDNFDLLRGLSENIEAFENARSEDDMELAAAKLFSMAGILWFPRRSEKPETLSARRNFVCEIGNQVHSLMQAHYWATHTNDILMFEDFLVAGPSLLTKIWAGVQWGGAYEWIPLIRAALMVSSREDEFSTKQPDILNLTGKRLYEIKTILGAPKGIAQVLEYQARLAGVMDGLLLGGVNPGDWRPFPIYYVGGTLVVTTCIYAPGVIAYQRLGTRVPGVLPIQYWSEQKQLYYQRQAQRVRAATAVALVAFGFIGALLLAAGVAAAAGALFSSGTLAGGGELVPLAIKSGLAYAM
jgi:hypothetical protein